MKLFLIFLLVQTQLFASYSQVVNLNEKAVKINVVLKKIQDQTGYSFVITNSILQDVKARDYNISNKSLQEALELITKGQNLTYEISDNVIIINKHNPAAKEAAPATDQTVRGRLQQEPVRGRVVDENGEPVIAATVRTKSGSAQTKTDDNGNFRLPIPSYNEVIQVSFLGFKPYEANAAPVMNIRLSRAMAEIDEVVAVGYGSVRRRDLTGSVASVNVEEIKNTPFVSIDQALAGKAPGVQVVQADGSPGGVARIRIRGGSSLIGGNDPLYIIDGLQVQISNKYIQAAADIVNPIERMGSDSQYTNSTVGSAFGKGLNTLAGLNINDIESIDILKDASATAIYGSRAANGVVIITTKKGNRDQKPLLEANYYSGFSQAITEKLLNAQQYRDIFEEGARNLNALRAKQNRPADAIATSILNDPAFLGTGNTDWLNLVTRTGVSHNVDLSVRGGGQQSRYYTSVAYNQQTGTLVGTDFDRFSGKINLDNEFTNNLRLITNFDFGFTKNNITNGLYSTALFAPPTFEPYNEDGTPTTFSSASFGLAAYSGIQNPMALLSGINTSRNSMLLGSVALEYDILKDLKFRSSVSINHTGYHQLNYIPSAAMVSVSSGAESSGGGIATQAQSRLTDKFFENTLTWDKVINENNRLNFLAGTSWQISQMADFSASGQGFPDDQFLNGLSSAATAMLPTARESQNSLLSFYMRANYALKERYLLTLTARSDESSKFPRDNRVGYFPSFGAAWRLSEENFMKDIAWVDDVKIRANAGYTGTQNLGDNLFYTLYTPLSYGSTNALVPSQLGNDKITWESTLQRDGGVDIALFNQRLKLALGYYEKNTRDLLMAMPVANSTGFSSALVSVARIMNKGWEFDLRGDLVRTTAWNWNLALNISTINLWLQKSAMICKIQAR